MPGGAHTVADEQDLRSEFGGLVAQGETSPIFDLAASDFTSLLSAAQR